MTELEKLRRAKIPCPETGITVKHTLCDIYTPENHCGVDAYVLDGKVIKVEGTKEHPHNHGLLCTKGAANREYIYRADRLKTPMRRVGRRGEGKFEPITWEAAYDEITARLTKIKEDDGPDAVAVFSGYTKWYRGLLKRFAYSFGTINYGTESSVCFDATMMAWLATTGSFAVPDMAPNEEYEIEEVTEMELAGPERPLLPIDYRNTPVAPQGVKIEYSNHVPKEQKTAAPTNVPSYDVIDVDEQSILNDLTPNDVQYLAMKWGSSFKPSEWVKMEEMYQKYCGEFEISVDREAVLISMCKTSINMQRCLDSGDAANAQKFSSMFDQLRKSGAFTEAQKKEEKDHYLDSLGELVAAVEREGGVIPKFDYEFEVNPDKVDLTLKDMKSYTYNLVKNEMGLGDLIESYIQKLEQQMEEEKNKSLSDGLITSKAEEQQVQNDEYADDWLNNLEDSVAANADEFYAKFGNNDDEKYIEMIRANQQENGE